MAGTTNLSSLGAARLDPSKNLLDIASPSAALNNLGGVSQAAVAAYIAQFFQTSDFTTVQQNVLYLGLIFAAFRNVPVGLVDGIADSFNNLADINTAASSGYTFNSSAGTIGATQSAGGAVQTSGQAISASDYSTAYQKGYAFDGNTSTTWASAETGASINGVSWIGQDFGLGNPLAVSTILITGFNTGTNNVSSVYLETWDGGSWTMVGTFSLNTAASAQTAIAVPAGTGAHRGWRLRAAAGLTSTYGWGVAEITMQLAASAAAMTLQSATLPINAGITSPSSMRALLQVDGTSAAFALNTDLVVSLSRDGGKTFTAGTLVAVQVLPDGTSIYDTGWVSVAGQPVGNSTMTYKVTTPTQKVIVLTGVSMQVKP